MPIKSCRQCGKEFEARRTRQAHCSGACFVAKERAYSRRYRTTFSPERLCASNLVYAAVRQRRLIPQPCEVCAKRRTIAHHDDYAAPLDVRWLCRTHHRQHHQQFGPGRNSFRAEGVSA